MTSPKPKRNRLILVVIVLVVIFICCVIALLVGQNGTGEPTITSNQTAAPALPTSTPSPTDTPAPPTPTPQPIVFEGQGDTILSLDWAGLGLLRVSGNELSRHFAVTLYDGQGGMLDIPVNTTEPYSGITPLNFNGDLTTRFEVNAEGAWKIEVLPVSMARVLAVPGEISGRGDEVIVLSAPADLATVRGNQESRHFAVSTYQAGGRLTGVVVNTTEPYEGQVILGRDSQILAVTAIGDWHLIVTAAQ